MGGDNTIDASGDKNINLGDRGDVVIVDSSSTNGNVNIADGSGNDTVVVRGAMQTTFNMGEGNDVLIVTDNAKGNVTLSGYNYEEDVISIQQPVKSIANAVWNQSITFGDGGVININNSDGSTTSIDIDDGDTSDGWLVRLADPDGNKSLVGFTAESGGLVGDAALEESVLLVGNIDGKKLGGSSLQGGTRNDTIYAGEFDSVSAGAGRDFVSLRSKREYGAAINISEGITSIAGMNNSFGEEGDVLYIDDINMDTTSFTIDDNGHLIVKEAQEFKAIGIDANTVKGDFVRQLVRTDDGTYKVAIGGGSKSTIYVDDDDTPNVFIGNGAKVDFSAFTGEGLIDLGGDWMESSIGSGAAYFKGVTTITGGEGKMILKGGDGNDVLTAGNGATTLYGAGGKNTLVGADFKARDAGSTFVVLGVYDGAVNTIENFGFVGKTDYVDTIEFDFNTNHIKSLTVNSSNQVVFEVENSVGVVEKAILDKGANTDGTGNDFSVAGTVAQVAKNKLVYDNSAEYYYASGNNATVTISKDVESAASIWLDDPDSGKTFGGDIKVIDAKSFKYNAELAGNLLDNTIYGGKGDNSMWGGFGGNDLLVGGSGNDNFVYLHGNGNDTIQGAGAGDTIWLGDITLDQISAEASNSGVVLNINDGGKLNVVDGRNVEFKVSNGQGGFDTYKLNNSRQFEQQ